MKSWEVLTHQVLWGMDLFLVLLVQSLSFPEPELPDGRLLPRGNLQVAYWSRSPPGNKASFRAEHEWPHNWRETCF